MAETAPATWLKPEFLAQIKSTYIRIVDDLIRTALGENLTGINNVGAIGEAESFADIVVCDQHADAAIGEMTDQILNVADGDRVDAGERLGQQHGVGAGGPGVRGLVAPPLS